jgi:hypothetical protein
LGKPRSFDMEKSATVYYDGEVFRPEGPIDLEPNTRYVISIEAVPAPAEPENRPQHVETALEVLDRLTGSIEGPGDWAAEHDHYLYGTPKRSGEASK